MSSKWLPFLDKPQRSKHQGPGETRLNTTVSDQLANLVCFLPRGFLHGGEHALQLTNKSRAGVRCRPSSSDQPLGMPSLTKAR